MKRSLLTLALLASLPFALGPDLMGHGGQTPPPGPGNTGPGSGGGNGGPGSGGPYKPGDSIGAPGPQTPPPKVPPPTSGPGGSGGVGGGSPGGFGGPTSGGGSSGKKNRGTATWDRWETWWEFNKDPFIHRQARIGASLTEQEGVLTGAGERRRAARWDRPTRDDVQEIIVPVLRRALLESEAEILDSAAIALGRILRAEDAGHVFDDLKHALSSPHPTVRQSAILGLGVSGHRAAVPVLWEIMNDTRKGRALLRSGSGVQTTERAFAALALGYVSGPEMVPQLMRLIERASDQNVEVVASAVLALGLVPEAGQDVVPFFAGLLQNERIDRRIRAQVPITLGRLGEAAEPMVPTLVKIAADKKAGNDLRRSSVIALGRLTSAAETEVVQALRRLVRDDSDAMLRHFALIALGEMGARSLSDERREKEAADDVRAYLSSEVADPSHSVDLPWVALAAGILGRSYSAGSNERNELIDDIGSLFEKTGNPSTQGALAISLGLLEGRQRAAAVLARFEDSNDAWQSGFLAVSLGLMGCQEAREALTERMVEDENPHLRVEVATALAMLGDVEAADRLLAMLDEAPTFAVTGSVARALGRVGDRRVMMPLLALVEDDSRSEAVRGFSCVAVGLIAEKSALPWNAPLSVGSNYATGLRSQAEVLDIF